MTPCATYRLQFHAGFTFADAEAIVPYLDGLGISHVYASPITVARTGSTHGYDVVDPTRISPELGGEDGFRRLVATLRARGMGVIIDIVPNHMGVGAENPWWTDVLRHGPQSAYAGYFDIDFRHRIVLPVLGAPLPATLAAGELAVEHHDGRDWIMAYGEHRFPVRDEDQGMNRPLPVLLDRQHYRLAWWRTANDELNWRRFFTINELAGLRTEDPAVLDAVHALVFGLWDQGLIDGVRVDHVDGLTDPAGYCRRLRARMGDEAWIVVEKILGPGETLTHGWGVDGTSGYDFMADVGALLHDPAGTEPLAALWAEVSGRSADFAQEELQARQDMLAWQFAGQLDGCVAAFVALAHASAETGGVTPAMLRRAIERLLWVFPVYRTYGPDAPPGDKWVRDTAHARVARFVPPGEARVADWILAWLAGSGPGDTVLAAEAVRRFQQLSAPIAAKSVEDTAFYRYGRLLSTTDVGFDAERMSMSTADFHAAMAGRARDWPRAMLATATHDHKRGEDVRARLAVLSAIPERWRAVVRDWEAIADALGDGIDRGDRYMLFQTLVGAWPEDGATSDFGERVIAWQQKALREAKLRSSWEAPDAAYEARCAGLVRAMLGDARFVAAVETFVRDIAAAATANALAQVALRCTVPGVPDCYQGSEWGDLSLVDPDNRRPVDYTAASEGAKPRLVAVLLGLRREMPELFADGSYEPAVVEGSGAERVVAFTRVHERRALRVAVAVRHAPGREWADTVVVFGSERMQAAEMFADGPMWFHVTAGGPE